MREREKVEWEGRDGEEGRDEKEEGERRKGESDDGEGGNKDKGEGKEIKKKNTHTNRLYGTISAHPTSWRVGVRERR